jgi:biopolymer transport protein ExbD/biopolymer transport protein TolR
MPEMNVTPLVDVVLVLLIIFMVVIPAMDKAAKVELPSIFNPDPEAKSKSDPFTISLTTDGGVYLEQERLAPEDFAAALRAAHEREQARRIVLRGDRNVPYGEVRKLFKVCQDTGFPGISLRVNELKTET